MNDDYTLGFAVADVGKLPELVFINDVTGVAAEGINARKHLHEGGLTGTVFATDGVDLASLDFECYIVEGLHTWEGLGDVVHFQNGVGRHCYLPTLI